MACCKKLVLIALASLVLGACDDTSTPSVETTGRFPHCTEQARHDSCFELNNASDVQHSTLQQNPERFSIDADGLPMAVQLVWGSDFFNSITHDAQDRVVAVGGPRLQLSEVSGEDAAPWQTERFSEYGDVLRAATWARDGTAFAVGSHGVILARAPGHEGWERHNQVFSRLDDPARKALEFDGDAYGVAIADAQHAVVVGEERILRTQDGGMHWKRVPYPLKDIALQDVQFVDAQTGWAVGSGGTLLRSGDQGRTWHKVQASLAAAHLMGLDFSDPQHGCVAGGYRVWCTADGGGHWQESSLDTPGGTDLSDRIGFTRVRFQDARRGWLVGKSGLVMRTADGGQHWQYVTHLSRLQGQTLTQAELWGLTIANGRVWAAGTGWTGDQTYGSNSLKSGGLVVSWAVEP
ncbi:Ycf48-like protein [Pseudomonas fluorescens]|uniref:YCF48-related protein n=1 Tax=Pseudomonas fluorescens TaxID=294 RepID=UPI001259FBBB|nr:YCF48-related protein [Pseudomonas fluorescens]CAG8863337.1 Ycf48-like protein [Pseudomonas fluorescens]